MWCMLLQFQNNIISRFVYYLNFEPKLVNTYEYINSNNYEYWTAVCVCVGETTGKNIGTY